MLKLEKRIIVQTPNYGGRMRQNIKTSATLKRDGE